MIDSEEKLPGVKKIIIMITLDAAPIRGVFFL